MATETLNIIRRYSADTTQWRRAVDQINRSSASTAQSLKRMDAQMSSATRTVANMGRAFAGGFVASRIAEQVRDLAIDIAQTGESTRLLTRQMASLAGNANGITLIADAASRLGVGLSETADAVRLFSPAFQRLGKSFSDATTFSEQLIQALRAYGVDGQAAVSVTTQLAQGLSSGTLAGDELKSLSENAGQLALELERAIQKTLNTTDTIKELGSQGKLTAEVVLQAFEIAFGKVEERVKRLPETMAQQQARISTAWDGILAALDEQLRLSRIWTWFTGGLAKQLENIQVNIGGVTAATPTGAVERQLEEVRARVRINRELLKTAQTDANRRAIQLDINRGLLEQSVLLQKLDERAQQASKQYSYPDLPKPGDIKIPKLKGVDPDLGARVEAMIRAAAEQGIKIGVTSGLRSTEKQAKLWANALQKYGSAAVARKYVAPPGRSRHESGRAVDLDLSQVKRDAENVRKLNELLEQFGLTAPVRTETAEAWGRGFSHIHVEAQKAADGVAAVNDAGRKAAALDRERSRAINDLTSDLQQYAQIQQTAAKDEERLLTMQDKLRRFEKGAGLFADLQSQGGLTLDAVTAELEKVRATGANAGTQMEFLRARLAEFGATDVQLETPFERMNDALDGSRQRVDDLQNSLSKAAADIGGLAALPGSCTSAGPESGRRHTGRY